MRRTGLASLILSGILIGCNSEWAVVVYNNRLEPAIVRVSTTDMAADYVMDADQIGYAYVAPRRPASARVEFLTMDCEPIASTGELPQRDVLIVFGPGNEISVGEDDAGDDEKSLLAETDRCP